MTIGSLLKKYRLEQGKTQAKFVGKIIDRSYYAKVENEIHQISARDLISILAYNGIDLSDFFTQINEKYESYKKQILHQRKLMEQAYYKVDIKQMQKIKHIINESGLLKSDKETQNLLVEGFIELLKVDDKPNLSLQKELKEKIFDIPEFNKTKFMLYCNSMRFYSFQDNKIITRKLVRRYGLTEDTIIQKDLLSIVINLLAFSIEENKFNDIGFCFSYVNSIPTTPDICFYKNVIQFFECLIKYKQSGNGSFLEICDVIIKNLSISSMKNYSLELSKFKNKYQ